jgi:alcohol dehydrogenase YqhD (iron-dependent ADH family)
MENFTFHNPTKIIFGKDAEKKVSEEAGSYRKVLLHYGEGSIKRSGLHARIVRSLKEAGVPYVELPGVKPNPLLDLVYEGVRICREEGVDLILAVGGGSVIDSAKAIAMGACYQGDVWDFYIGKAVPQAALPVGVVLTIAAAGSDSSDSSVISRAEGQMKRPCGSRHIYPKFAILNPELTCTLPPYQTACGIADITAHLLERYFTPAEHVDLSDRLIEAALKTVQVFGPRAMENPHDYEARAEIMWAGTLAHNNLLGMGRIGDWGSHMIEHEISAIYDVAHGAGLAVVFPAWMLYVYRANPQRFVQFAVRVWNVNDSLCDPERVALEGIARQKQFFKSLGLPVSLAEMKIDATCLQEMASKATLFGPLGNFKKLQREDVFSILQLALS